MNKGCPYGTHRVLEPAGEMPQPAWKLDTNLPIYSNEILINAERLNLNSASFAQLLMECGPDSERMAEKILYIVRKRGKMHNPVTGTGGMLLGAIEDIGPDHPAIKHAAPGQRVVTLVSLTLTPLAVDSVKRIHLSSGQVDVDGRAILFESGTFYLLPDDIQENVLLAVLDEAGAPAYTYSLAAPGKRVLVVGAEGKIGALCLFAARDRLGSRGEIVAVVHSSTAGKDVEKLHIADHVLVLDTTDTIAASRTYEKKIGCPADLTIDCVDVPGSEFFSVMNTCNGGKIYFASLASRYTVAALGAEGMARDVDLLLYKGFSSGHADYTVNLLRRHTVLQDYLEARFLNGMVRSKSYHPAVPANYRLSGEFPPSGVESRPGNFALEKKAMTGPKLQGIVLASREMHSLSLNAVKVAPYDANILITGETGVGKEVFAELIHKFSRRCHGSLLKLNCAAIPESLLEAELFGYEKGSFTGANQAGKIGLFEAARGGTFFLDEIGDMSPSLQAKLLRVLQDKAVMRIGGVKPVPIDVRLIAATNRPLREMMDQGRFRPDLYYRLNVVEIRIPPLRERRDDIIPLAEHFLALFNERFGACKTLSPQALQILLEYDWPGNVREIENLVQRLVLCTREDVVSEKDVLDHLGLEAKPLPRTAHKTVSPSASLRKALGEIEKRMLEEARQKGHSTREIAALLNTSQSTVVRKLHKYGLS
ncbi:MAG: sigma 54-interacting transcriptional regulator [Bacillota bacterium]